MAAWFYAQFNDVTSPHILYVVKFAELFQEQQLK